MEPLALIYLGATLAVLYLAALAALDDWRRRGDLLLCAALLFALCLIGNLLYVLRPEPDAFRADPALDMAAALAVAWMLSRRRSWWKAALLALFFAQLGVEVWAWTVTAAGRPFPVAAYGWAINTLFVGQLLCVALPGGIHVGVRLCDLLSPRRARRRAAASARRSADGA